MNSKDSAEPVYRISFLQQDEHFELLASFLYQSELIGFVELEGIIWPQMSALVDDPKQEKLKTMFAGVKRTFIPIMSILRIDEVDGDTGRTFNEEPDLQSNVTHFPTALFPPRRD